MRSEDNFQEFDFLYLDPWNWIQFLDLAVSTFIHWVILSLLIVLISDMVNLSV